MTATGIDWIDNDGQMLINLRVADAFTTDRPSGTITAYSGHQLDIKGDGIFVSGLVTL